AVRALIRATALAGFVLAFGMVTSACHDDDDGDTAASIDVDTRIKPQIVTTGQAASVTCTTRDSLGNPVVTPTRITVTPEAVINGLSVVANTPGHYQVTCATESGAADPTPANLYVIGPDDADLVVVDTTLSASQIALNASATATCTVALDGQTLTDIETEVRVDPPTGIAVEDHLITGTTDGDYEVSCAVRNTSFVDLSPAPLRVGIGNPIPARIETALSETTIASGDTVDVTCRVFTADNQQIEKPTFVDAPNGLGVTGKSILAQQVGTYEVTCRLDDGDDTVEHVPADLVVTPGDAKTIDAWATPDKPSYKPGDVITIEWEVKDAFGNVVPDATVTVAAPTTGTQDNGDNKYELLEDGNMTFVVSLADGGGSDTVELVVDGNGPVIVITTPERGMTFDGDPNILVAGTISDSFGGVQSFTVNGKTVTADEAGNWSTTVESVHAMNPVLAESTDVNGNYSKTTVTWYYSTEWAQTDAAFPDAAWLDQGVQVWLSQEMIDDNDHTGQPDDIAHLLEILLTNANLAQLAGEVILFEQDFPGIVNQPDIGGSGVDVIGDMKLWADISTISFGDATLNLKSRDGGIDLDASINGNDTEKGMTIGLQFHVSFSLSASTAIDLGGGLLIPVELALEPPPTLVTTSTLELDKLDLDTSFDIYMLMDQLQIDGQQLGAIPEGFHLSALADAEIDLGEVTFSIAGFGLFSFPLGVVSLQNLVSGLDSLIAGLVDPLLNAIVPLVTDILDPIIADLGGTLLETALKSLEIDQMIPIPELIPGQPTAEVSLKARIGDVAFSDAGAILGLVGASVAEKKVDRDPLGTLMHDGCGSDETPYALPTQGTMEFAVKMDLINELLFSFWYNGGLNLNLDSQALSALGEDLPLDNAEIVLKPLLAPVMTDCNDKGTLKVQLGEAYMEASLGLADLPVEFKAWLSVEVDVGLVAQGDELGVVVNGISTFQLELFDVKGTFEGNEAALENLIKGLIDTLLGDLLTGSLAQFPIPSFDLTGLAPGVPEGTELKLGNLGISKSKGYLQIEGSLLQ
ncbi:MAG: hypothetical protein ACI9OJ_003679, partial [Myxococcota bacterium]